MKKIIEEFDKIAQHYDSERRALIPCFDDFYGVITELADLGINPGGKILDIGAGTGLLTQFLLLKYPLAHYILIDISGAMLNCARSRFTGQPNIHFITDDYVNYDFHARFDLVVSSLSIHHLPDKDKKQLYENIYALLDARGLFINGDQFTGSSVYNEKTNQEHWRAKIEASELPAEQKAGAYARMKLDRTATVDANIKWLRKAGFKEVDLFYKYYNFGVIRCRK